VEDITGVTRSRKGTENAVAKIKKNPKQNKTKRQRMIDIILRGILKIEEHQPK
jgi:hypothetical protein